MIHVGLLSRRPIATSPDCCHHGSSGPCSEEGLGEPSGRVRADRSRGPLLGGARPCERLLQVLRGDLASAPSHRQEDGLVDDVGQLGATQTLRGLRDALQHAPVRRLQQRLSHRRVPRVELQNLEALLLVRQLHEDVTVEAAGPQQCRVHRLAAVRRREHHDAVALAVEAVELGQQLVEGLDVLLVGRSALGIAPSVAQGIQLVNEDHHRRHLTSLPEKVSHPCGSTADVDLHKFRGRGAEKGATGLASDGASQQRLACPARPDQQCAAGQLGAGAQELRGVVEEVDDFRQLDLALAHDVGEARCLRGGLALALPGHELLVARDEGLRRLVPSEEHEEEHDVRQNLREVPSHWRIAQ
mmetsp:Transcript_163094/g.522986  ORF Transcript_163094/g.522986 Transcript_163094/m.522986 type:complete len:357 (+) Transcript_163094:69-1139(+)